MTAEEDYIIFNSILEPIFREKLQVNKGYLSPIPRNNHYETSPSFRVTEWRGRLNWRDWGLADQSDWTASYLLMRLHNLTREEADFLIDNMDFPHTEIKYQKKYKLVIEDRERLTPTELLYWLSFGVREDTLRLFNVRGVDRLTAGKSVLYAYSEDQAAFSYRGGQNLEAWQFYSPNPKSFWRKGSFVLGLDQLPRVGDNLVFTSGLKDGLAFFEASGLPFVAWSGEGAWRQCGKYLEGLRKRFKNIYTLFDPNSAGKLATLTFKKELNVPPLKFDYPDERDIADLSRDCGASFLGERIFKAL